MPTPGCTSRAMDVDLELVADRDELLRAVPALKARLQVHGELAHFIPELPGWAKVPSRSFMMAFTRRHSRKSNAGHLQDWADVRLILDTGLVEEDGASCSMQWLASCIAIRRSIPRRFRALGASVGRERRE